MSTVNKLTQKLEFDDIVDGHRKIYHIYMILFHICG